MAGQEPAGRVLELAPRHAAQLLTRLPVGAQLGPEELVAKLIQQCHARSSGKARASRGTRASAVFGVRQAWLGRGGWGVGPQCAKAASPVALQGCRDAADYFAGEGPSFIIMPMRRLLWG